MTIVNVLEAKTQLSKLIDAVESGREDEIVIARNGKPAVRLVPLAKPKQVIRFGLAAGKYPPMSLEEFNAADKEIEAMFLGGEIEPDVKPE